LAVTLYAQWTINAYTVAYAASGATGGSVPTDVLSPYDYGTTVTVLGAGSLARTGYSFDGWNTAANGSGIAYQPGDTFPMPALAVTLYPQWTINAYAVAYDGNDATGGLVPADGLSPYNYGTVVTVLGGGSLARTGYSFNGWNTQPNGGGIAYDPGDTFPMPPSAVTLYAQWTINTYAVSYGGNGATGGSVPSDGSSPHGYQTTVTVLGAGSMTRSGHSFYGWNTEADGSGASYQPGDTFPMPASDVTLYALWAIKLHPGTTRCRGTYAGTGAAVVVRSGDACTLVPGAHVTNGVTVKLGGILHVDGVRIGGNLTTAGSTTVCGSRIGHAVVGTAGSLTLGGQACAGNRIAGDVVVTDEANDVWIWNNTIKGGLTVKRLRGATESIVGNVIFINLLVAHSGPPVEVSGNQAANARCAHNAGQTGSGNVARGTNTCPR
jgi:uncharacterized repeat protein (TIGR02543 family)